MGTPTGAVKREESRMLTVEDRVSRRFITEIAAAYNNFGMIEVWNYCMSYILKSTEEGR